MELPESIIDSVRSGRVVLFLGTEFLRGSTSATCNIPSENDLRAEISKSFLGGSFSQESLQWVTELAISEAGLDKLQNFIAEKFRDIKPANSHLILPTFRWKAIVTTNYDRLTEITYENSKNKVQKLVPILSNDDKIDEKIKYDNSLALIKLHGCITRTQDSSIPLILDTGQYSTHRKNREYLFKSFYEWCHENPVIFIGGGTQDSKTSSILLQVLNEVRRRPPYYLIQPKVSSHERKLWESKGIMILEGDFEDFIRALDRAIAQNLRPLAQALKLSDHPIQRKFVRDEPIAGSLKDLLTHDVDYIHKDIEISEGNPKQFYKGFDLGWYPIVKELDIRRNLTDTVLYDVILRADEERPTLSELYLIKAEAGAGKSVFLRRLSWEASTSADVTCLYCKSLSSVNFDAIRELFRLINERIFLFIDSAADNISLIISLIEDARKYKVPLTVITTARINEWNMSCERLNEYINEAYQLRYLSETEVKNLIELLEKHEALGPNLQNKSLEERAREFGERAGRQLLVALHEATSGRPFREIIVDEYRHIYPTRAQNLYLTVCFLNRLNTPVRAGLIARVHGISFTEFKDELFTPLEHVVRLDEKRSSDVCYLARHSQIAQIVFDEILSENVDRYHEYIRVLEHINTLYDSDKASFRKLMKAKTLKDVFNNVEDVRAIYDSAEEYIDEDAYLCQQRANYERLFPDGNHQLAEELLARAREIEPWNNSIIHSQAELAASKAEQADHALERQKFRNQSFYFLNELINADRAGSDRYARNTYLKLAIDNLHHILDQENPIDRDIEDAVRVIEKMLEDTKQKYPEDTFVRDSEASFAHLIEDNERALKALENASKVNPRDPYIAMRLAALYKRSQNFELAKDCLGKALDAHPFDKELNYEFAQILRSISPAEIDSLIYYFGRSYSKTDRNNFTKFWYARYLFESSENEKYEMSKRIFKLLRHETIKYEPRMKIRDYIKDGSDLKKFTGRVSSLQLQHGFIMIDGKGIEVFFHHNAVPHGIWDKLKTEDRVSFSIGFNFKGATAVHIGLL